MSSGSPPTFRHFFIDISHHFGYIFRRISLCKGRRSRGCSRLCGASAVPAGGTTHSVPGRLRASSGRHYDRSVGCATGLGQAGAGNARNNCVRCCLRKEDRLQIGVLATSQETWPEVARSGRKPASQSRGGTPTGELHPEGRAAVPAARQVEASVCRRSASLSCFCPCLKLRSVIAGIAVRGTASLRSAYDPAIHAEVKRDRAFRSCFASRKSPRTTGSSPVVTREIVAV